MNREKKLVKSTLIITISKISIQLITFVLLSLYTSILSTSEYGIVDLLNTLISLLIPIVTFKVEEAIFRELIEVRNKEKEKQKIISTGIITVSFQCLIYLIIFILISSFINNNYKIFLIINVIAYIYLSLFQQISRGLGNNKKYALSGFISALFIILFNILFLVVIKLGVRGMLLATMLGETLGAIYLFFSLKLYKYIKVKAYKKNIIKKLWKYSLPLIPNSLCWWVFKASDRIIVALFLGIDQNGILAVSLMFSSAYVALYNIFNISWVESFSAAINDKDVEDYFNKMFNKVLNLFSAMAVGMITCMPFLFSIMINESYNYGYYLVPLLILASLFNVVVGLVSAIYIAKKDTKKITHTSIIAALINIIVHLSLIKFVGLYAAVISTFVSFLIISIYRIIDIRKRYFNIIIDKKLIIKTILVLIIILPLYYINNFYLNILSIMISIIYAFDINRKLIETFKGIIKRKMV